MTAADRLAARIGLPLVSRYFEADGRRLHAVTAGSGPPLLLVHGLNIGWGQWYAVLPELARDHTVIALDLTGAGAADKVDFLEADIATLLTGALEAALETLAPHGATIVGHSIGGWAALKLAARHHPAVRAVVAVDPVGFTDLVPPSFRPLALRPVAQALAATVMRPTRANLGSFLGGVMADPAALAPEFIDYFHEHVTRPPVSHPFLLIHRLFRPFRFREEFVLSDAECADIAVPVVIVHGALDPLIPLAAVRTSFARIPAARLTVLDGVGHAPPLERPAEFVDLIRQAVPALPEPTR